MRRVQIVVLIIAAVLVLNASQYVPLKGATQPSKTSYYVFALANNTKNASQPYSQVVRFYKILVSMAILFMRELGVTVASLIE